MNRDLKLLSQQTDNNNKNITSNKIRIKSLGNKIAKIKESKKNYDNMIVSVKQQKTNQISNKKYVKLEYYSSKILILLLSIFSLFIFYSLAKQLI